MSLRNHKKLANTTSITMTPFKMPRIAQKDLPINPETAAEITEAVADVDTREIYFLIMHFLLSGPCRKISEHIWNELLKHDLLPRRYHAWYSRSGAPCSGEDDNGSSFPLTYQDLVSRYPHIATDHLVKLMKQLVLFSSFPSIGFVGGNTTNGIDVSSLLGSGAFSLLGSDKGNLKKSDHCPRYLRWPHMHANQVHGLSLREIGGGFAKHSRAPSIRAACYAIAKPSTMVQKMPVIKKLRGHQNAVYCAIFDRSGRYVITGSDDRLVKIWSMETGFCLSSCRGHEGDITDLTVSSKNDLVASGSNDFTIRVWRLPDGLPISVLKGHNGGVTAITFSPRPTSMYHLLSSSDDGTCRIWDARYSNPSLRVYIPKTLERRNTNPESSSGHRVHQILCCAYNANGTIFVTGSSDTYARVWIACRTNQEDSEMPNHEMDLLSGHENDVNYVQFSGCAVPSKSSTVDNSKEDNIPKFKNSWFTHDNIVTCSRDGSAIIWIPRSRKSHGKVGKWIRAYHLKVPPPPLPPQPPRGGPRQRSQPTPRGVNMIVWSLDNRFVLAAIMDRRICVWNASDGSLVHSLMGHNDSTFVLDVHPFNPRIAMSAGYDGKTIIWDIWEGIPVRIYETGHFKLVDGKFSPDGTSIVLSDEVGQIFIIATGQGESQKDAKYDQFFLGDYRPLIHDVHGSTLDQETQLAPYSRNMQDLLCDSSMIPYPEPYQSMYQRRRLSALGIEWRPPSLQFAVGPSDNINVGEYQTLPIVDLERWVENLQAMPDFVDAMDWEQENEVQSDDNDSEYNVTEELSSEREYCSLSSSGDLESSAEESEDNNHSGREGLRRSRRKESKRSRRDAVFTTSGRRVKRKNLDEHEDTIIKSKMKKRARNGASTSKKKSSKSKLHRPQRRAAKNARSLFSKYDEEASSEDEVAEASDSYTSESDSPVPDFIDHSNESESSDSLTEQSHGKRNKRCEYEEVSRQSLNETPSNAIPKKKLVLRLPFRDPMKNISSDNTTARSHGQNEFNEMVPSAKDASTSSNVNGLLPSPQKLDSSSLFKDDPILSQCDAGNLFLGVQAQKAEYQYDIPVGCMVSKGSWGEVKTRSAKRTRLCETSAMETLKTCPMDSEDAIVVSRSVNGHIKSENDCQASFSQPRSQSNGHALFMEDYQKKGKCANGISEALDCSTNQEPVIDNTLTLENPLQNGISNEKNTLLDASKNIGKEMIGNLDENNVESVNQKLIITSKNPDNEPGSSSSKLTLVAKHPGSLNGFIQDAGGDGNSELISWTNGSSRISRGQNLVYSRSNSKSRRGSKEDIDGIKDSSSTYLNHKDNQNVDVNCNLTTKIHFTRSSSAKTNMDNPSSSSRSRWNFDNSEEHNFGAELRSSRNKRENCISSDLSSLNSGRNGSVLMLSEHEEFYRYIPQLGDEVAYLREGHAEYLVSKLAQLPSEYSINGNLDVVEFCKVISLGYSQFPGSGSSCCKITLEFNDPKSCAFGNSFDLTLVDFDEIPEFLVEKTRYHACMERNWTTRDKCRVWWRTDDAQPGSWYYGRIVSKASRPNLPSNSPWERYKIVYNCSNEEYLHSPWELEDLNTKWVHPHIDEVVSRKIVSSLEEIEETSQINKDKHGLQKFIKASQKAEYQNRFPVPLSLEIIKKRLQNKYYRTLDAVGNDVEVMLSNAESYFGKSHFSSKIHKLKDIFKRAIQK